MRRGLHRVAVIVYALDTVATISKPAAASFVRAPPSAEARAVLARGGFLVLGGQ